MNLDTAALRAQIGTAPVPPLLRGLIKPSRRRVVESDEGVPSALVARLTSASPEEQVQILLEVVRAQVAAVLGHASADAVDPARPFNDLGFDSLSAVELRNSLNAATGLRLPATLVFDYPNPLTLTGHLREELVRHDTVIAVPALADLMKLEASLPVATLAGAERTDIRARLESLLSTLYEPADGGVSGDRLDAATDDELFDLIDKDLEVF
jgi:acyl carrier protein